IKSSFKMVNDPRFAPKEEAKEEPSGSGQPGGGSGPPGGGSAPPGGMAMGGGGDKGGKQPDLSETPNKIKRTRYVLCNQVVRRVPIAFTVFIDQDYRNEVLTAVANSTMRVQTTQVYWSRRDEKAVGGKKDNELSGGFQPPGGFGGSGPMGGGSRMPEGAGPSGGS